MTAYQIFETLTTHDCIYQPENEWWPTKAEAFKPIPTMPPPPPDPQTTHRTSRPCNINLKLLSIEERNLPFQQETFPSQLIIMKHYIENHHEKMSHKTMFRPITSPSTSQLFEQVQTIYFDLQSPGILQMVILKELLQKEIVFSH